MYHLENRPATLAVGPVSNHAPDHQLLKIDLQHINELEPFAHQVRINNWQKSSQTNFLSGFCLLLKVAALNIVGGLDTRFWPGNFEDDDYCLRIKLAGYDLLIAHDVFIYHAGGQTFTGQSFNYSEIMQVNWQQFREKWGLPEDYNPNQRRIDLAEKLKGRYQQEELYLPVSGT